MTWIATREGSPDWHFISEQKNNASTTICGIEVESEMKPYFFSGDEEPKLAIFDPPVPICEKCREWRLLKELAK